MALNVVRLGLGVQRCHRSRRWRLLLRPQVVVLLRRALLPERDGLEVEKNRAEARVLFNRSGPFELKTGNRREVVDCRTHPAWPDVMVSPVRGRLLQGPRPKVSGRELDAGDRDRIFDRSCRLGLPIQDQVSELGRSELDEDGQIVLAWIRSRARLNRAQIEKSFFFSDDPSSTVSKLLRSDLLSLWFSS